MVYLSSSSDLSISSQNDHRRLLASKFNRIGEQRNRKVTSTEIPYVKLDDLEYYFSFIIDKVDFEFLLIDLGFLER